MLTISKSLSASQAQTYHKQDFASETQSYYRQGNAVEGEWQGQLAARFGLSGAVSPLEFQRLSEGLHPATEQPMVRSRAAFEYKNADGETIKTVEHRAGWDATFSAPKSVSLTALVGGDDRVREAHRAAVTEALNELERYTQARIGGNPSGRDDRQIHRRQVRARHGAACRWLRRAAASYPRRHLQRHRAGRRLDTRPATAFALREPAVCDGRLPVGIDVPAPQSRLRDRARQERRARDQRLLAGVSGRFEPTLPADTEQLEKTGRAGAEAAEIAAHSTRDRKQNLTAEQVLDAHRKMAASSATSPKRSLPPRGSAPNSSRSNERAAPRPKKPSPSLARASSSGRQSSMNAEFCATPCAGEWERQLTGRFARSSRPARSRRFSDL
jgi:hypothetical protein